MKVGLCVFSGFALPSLCLHTLQQSAKKLPQEWSCMCFSEMNSNELKAFYSTNWCLRPATNKIDEKTKNDFGSEVNFVPSRTAASCSCKYFELSGKERELKKILTSMSRTRTRNPDLMHNSANIPIQTTVPFCTMWIKFRMLFCSLTEKLYQSIE